MFGTEVSKLEPMGQIWPTICLVSKVVLNHSLPIYVLSMSFFALQKQNCNEGHIAPKKPYSPDLEELFSLSGFY